MRRIVSAALTLLMAFSVMLMVGGTASANALAGGGYSSSYAGESVFLNKAAGESGQFSAIFFNDGRVSWSPGVVGLLVCLADKVTCNVASPNAAYASGWTSTTVYATVSATVAPGQNGFFIYNFAVPAGTAPGTVATFNGDVGLIGVGTELRPEGYFQVNTTPGAVTTGMAISPTSAALPVGGQQQFTVTGAPAGSTVSFTVEGGCGAVTSTGLFAATATNSPTQPCNVVATAGGQTVKASLVVFGPATQMSCTANPTTIPTNQASSSVKVTLLDANGNVVANDNSSLIVFTNNTTSLVSFSGSTPNEGSSITASFQRGRYPVNGVATLTVLSNTSGTGGTAVISATDNANSSVAGCSVNITVTPPGNPTQLLASFQQGKIAADATSRDALEVDVADANGSVVLTDSSDVITISQTSGASVCNVGGSGSATLTVTGGSAYFIITSTTTPGTCTWLATTSTVGISSASATLTTNLTGAPNQVAIAGNASPKVADGAATLRLSVALQDASGNPVTGPLYNATGASAITLTATLGNGCSGTKADGTFDSVRIADTNGGTPPSPGTAATVAADTSQSTSSFTSVPSSQTTFNSSPPSAQAFEGSRNSLAGAAQAKGLANLSAMGGGGSASSTTNLSRFILKSTFATSGCTVTVTASGGGLTINSTTATVVFTGLGPSGIACSFSPTRVLGDGSSTSIATVSIVDINNNVSTAGTFSVSFVKVSGSATTLLTSSPQNTNNGVTTFTVRSSGNGVFDTDQYKASTTIAGTTVTSSTATGNACQVNTQPAL